uniref:Crossover junction endonuclease MUS81 n=1 Tax=Hirondellea gigas TaxID=1518452 RepID=A0A6A7G8E3_9CRUS
MNEETGRVRKKARRQTVKYRHANPLFDQWIQDWEEQAKKADSNMRFNFARARKALRLFPLPVYCGTDCKVLQYFGDKLCSMIDKKIAKYEEEHGPIDWNHHIKADRSKVKRKKRSRKSAEHAGNRRALNTGNANNNPGDVYAGNDSNYNAIATNSDGLHPLSNDDCRSIPAESLSSVSAAVANSRPAAKRKQPMAKPRPAKVARKGSAGVSTKAASAVNLPTVGGRSAANCESEGPDAGGVLFTLPADSYDVMLCVDLAETTSKSSKQGIVKELKQNGVLHDVRKLHVGDFTWVAREKEITTGKSRREIILPCIVERKRMDDLASSIKDGRCREQKHRLLQCGIDTTVYLVETAGQHHAGLPLSTCNQAIANTSVVDGLLVRRTADYRESAAYLTLTTRVIQNMYQGRSIDALRCSKLPSPCPLGSTRLLEFNTFNNSAMKNKQLTAQQMLAKHLLQLAGLSVQKVAAIVKEVLTSSGLVTLVSSSGGTAKLAELKAARSGRSVGVQAAAAITALYTQQQLY